MVSYGLTADEEYDSSFDTLPQRPQTRKRTYPNAFPEDSEETGHRDEIYPDLDNNTSIPVAIESSQEGLVPLGLTPSSVMDCLKTTFGWIRYAMVEYGGKFFNAGTPEPRVLLMVVGSWMERKKSFHGDERPVPKRQRVLPERTDLQDDSERSPLLISRPPQQSPRSPLRQTKPKPHPASQGPFFHQVRVDFLDFQDSFLSGAPYIESRHLALPEVPRRRFPPPSRTQRLKNITSRLQSQSQSSIPSSGAIRKSHAPRPPGPYDRLPDRKTSHQDAESRLAALEQRAQQLQSQPILPTQPPVPTYKWGDEEVAAEFRRPYRRTQKQPVSIPPPVRESPQPFDFKFSTPIPTHFKFGGRFTSPPQSGAPEYVKTGGRVSGLEKAQFTFELPPTVEKERVIPPQMNGFQRKGNGIKSSKTDKPVQSSSLTQPRQTSQDHRRHQSESESNTFTIITRQEPKDKSLIHKSLPSKSQVYTYEINTQRTKQEPPLSQSFPQSNDSIIPATPSTPSHRRTKSVVTPTRSSRRSKMTSTYAEDSHREFMRDLRQALGQKKAQKELEEREIDQQIKKLREEGQAVESTLAGELPKLPELLARKVHEALFDTPDNAVVVENAFGKLCGRDIHRLQKGEWLNDEIINYYLSMVKERSFNPAKVHNSKHSPRRTSTRLPRVFAFNTFFYSLLSARGYAGVRRWTKKAKVNLFELDRVVIPINKGGFHWILVIVNVKEKRIEYYDSMGREGESNENRPVLMNVRSFMVEEAKIQNHPPEQVATWSFHVPKTPKQKNGWDCGVFTCITAERLTGEVGRMNYGQDHMDRLREYMVAEIIDGVFYH